MSRRASWLQKVAQGAAWRAGSRAGSSAARRRLPVLGLAAEGLAFLLDGRPTFVGVRSSSRLLFFADPSLLEPDACREPRSSVVTRPTLAQFDVPAFMST